MSFKVYFDMSVSTSRPIKVPKDTIAKIMERIKFTETALGLETEQYGNNPKRWKSTKPKDGVSDEVFCNIAEDHNWFVRRLYENLAGWAEKPVEDGEVITPEESAEYWYGLRTIDVPLARWTRDYYVARMEALYEAMRGKTDFAAEGIVYENEPLTPEQAAGVFNIFAGILDAHDVRLDVPKNRDYLASFDDGGYEWCEHCRAVTYEHAVHCPEENCPAKENLGLEEDEDE